MRHLKPFALYFKFQVNLAEVSLSGGDATSSESDNENMIQQSPDTSKASTTEKKYTEDVEDYVEDIVIITGDTGPKDVNIAFHSESSFSSDRGLYSETVGNEKLKDLLAKQGPCQPTEDQLSFDMDARGRKFSITR